MLLIPVLFPCHTKLQSKSKDSQGTYSTGKKLSAYANEMLKTLFCFSEVLVLLMQGAQTLKSRKILSYGTCKVLEVY